MCHLPWHQSFFVRGTALSNLEVLNAFQSALYRSMLEFPDPAKSHKTVFPLILNLRTKFSCIHFAVGTQDRFRQFEFKNLRIAHTRTVDL